MDRRGEIKKTANKLEKTLAKEVGGRRVPGSGMLSGWKGDVETKDYLIDSKNTEKSTIALKSQDLAKITAEARDAGGKRGHLILTFLPNTHYAVVPRIDCDFEISGEVIECKKSKTLSKSQLSSTVKRKTKEGVAPCLVFYFEKIMFGTPKEWCLMPMEMYLEEFIGDSE